jgi:AcrR family transcriptional regulator
VKEQLTPAVRSRTDNVRRAVRLRRNEGVRSNELLEVALLLFSEEGYREVTMQKIADRLGIRHSLIYYYFESKDKLFHSALLHALERLMAAYDEVKARHDDPVDIINDWFRLNVDQEQLLKGLINIMIDHASNERRRTPRFVDDIVRLYGLSRTLADNPQRVKAGLHPPVPGRDGGIHFRNIDGSTSSNQPATHRSPTPWNTCCRFEVAPRFPPQHTKRDMTCALPAAVAMARLGSRGPWSKPEVGLTTTGTAPTLTAIPTPQVTTRATATIITIAHMPARLPAHRSLPAKPNPRPIWSRSSRTSSLRTSVSPMKTGPAGLSWGSSA